MAPETRATGAASRDPWRSGVSRLRIDPWLDVLAHAAQILQRQRTTQTAKSAVVGYRSGVLTWEHGCGFLLSDEARSYTRWHRPLPAHCRFQLHLGPIRSRPSGRAVGQQFETHYGDREPLSEVSPGINTATCLSHRFVRLLSGSRGRIALPWNHVSCSRLPFSPCEVTIFASSL